MDRRIILGLWWQICSYVATTWEGTSSPEGSKTNGSASEWDVSPQEGVLFDTFRAEITYCFETPICRLHAFILFRIDCQYTTCRFALMSVRRSRSLKMTAFWNLPTCSLVQFHKFCVFYITSSVLKMETVCSSKTSISTYESTRRHKTITLSSSTPWDPQISYSTWLHKII
jgi:hypothetical protein